MKGEWVLSKLYECRMVEEKLLESRILFIDQEINARVASDVVAKLLYLDSLNHEDIVVYINSPGGEISSGFMIYDTFSFIQSDVQTISLGTSASMAALLLLSGTKGKRKILENSNVMLHDLSGGTTGKYGDIMAATQHMQKTHRKIFDIIQKNTNLTDEEIEVNLKNDFWLDSEEALRYGIVDKIISSSN